MKKSYKYFGVLFIAVLFFNCSGSDDDGGTPINPGRTEADVRVDFQNLVVNTGINDFTLESNNENFFWDFRIIAPVGASSTNKRPLIISLHGDATTVSEAYKATACLAEPGLDGLGAYIISPSSKGFLWFDAPNQNQILALVDLASSYLSVDTNKIAITGYSDGGNGSWFFAQFYPSLFSASIPMASSYNPINNVGVVQQITIPMRVIHGSDDALFPIATTEGYVNDSNAAGSNIEFVTATGLGHLEPCNYVPYLLSASSWLEEEVWN
ncbi:dienelactone hydrolase family protein [Ichthyenterobacterium magnum]|uniref:Dienelactone hydrolase family protein n=1 Tax=Ichthyenterobacterium magnum TaxID=1230530 RepID=A0A420DGM4_9FLAO|nr:dienelactone hydrolase family protein [Ichthyenterobacterium magnum]RKE92227.1 dienelactone hydrolase family protein [Ichthyenterobacterium magnum]